MATTTERILSLIEKSGQSQYYVTKNAGLTKNTVTEWRAERSKPSADAIVKLARYFGVTTDYLHGLTDNPNPPQVEEGALQTQFNTHEDVTNTKTNKSVTTTERILMLIKQSERSQHFITRNAGLTMNDISDWKAGRAKPSTDAIVKLAKYFNVTTDYLFGLTNTPTSKSSNNIESINEPTLSPEQKEFLELFNKMHAGQKKQAFIFMNAILGNPINEQINNI